MTLPELMAPNPNGFEQTIYTGLRTDSLEITYYFAAAGETDSDGWTEAEKTAARTALETWTTFSPIMFREIANFDTADWILEADDDFSDLGAMHLPGDGQQFATFNSTDPTWGGIHVGGNGFHTLIHEFGHGLGLNHPHDDDLGSTLPPGVQSDEDIGDFGLNQTLYTVMSYNNGFEHPDAGEIDPVDYGYPLGPSALDIAVIQRMYGSRDANTGNDVYTLPSENVVGTGYATLWDTGGQDTIRAAGDGPVIINLTPATLELAAGGGGVVSFEKGIAGGLTIAAGVAIEHAAGGDFADDITGNDQANTLLGGRNRDVIRGEAGPDDLRGNRGADTLSGGTGNDVIDGGVGIDVVSYSTATRGVTVDLFEGTAVGQGADLLRNVESVLGSNFADKIDLSDLPGTGWGLRGADTITGGTGADTLLGGRGFDDIAGGDGADLLSGGRGEDLLEGGSGRDTLTGGLNGDAFVFASASDTGGVRADFDLITDFDADDLLVLEDIDAQAGGTDDAFTFIGDAGFSGQMGELRIVLRNGDSFVLADLDGDGVRDFGIEVRGFDLTVDQVAL